MSRRTGFWMWAEACEFIRRAERLQQQFFEPGDVLGSTTRWHPPMDVFETGQAVHILVALPGVEADQVEVLIQGGTVRITGERPIEVPAQESVIHRIEIPHGRFERRIPLPTGRYRIRRRDLVNGCLTLVLGKQ